MRYLSINTQGLLFCMITASNIYIISGYVAKLYSGEMKFDLVSNPGVVSSANHSLSLFITMHNHANQFRCLHEAHFDYFVELQI